MARQAQVDQAGHQDKTEAQDLQVQMVHQAHQDKTEVQEQVA